MEQAIQDEPATSEPGSPRPDGSRRAFRTGPAFVDRSALRIAAAWSASLLTGRIVIGWSVDTSTTAQAVLVLASSVLPAAVAVLFLTDHQAGRGYGPALLAAVPPEVARIALLLPDALDRGTPVAILVYSAVVGLLCAALGALGVLVLRRPGAWRRPVAGEGP